LSRCPWWEAGLDEKALRDAAAAHTMREVCCDRGAKVLLAGAVLGDAQWLTWLEKHLELRALDAVASFSEHRSALPKTLLNAMMQTKARKCRVKGARDAWKSCSARE
jgi:hypothetical protein